MSGSDESGMTQMLPKAVAAILGNRFGYTLVIIFLAFEIYNFAILPAYLGTLQAIQAKAVADNSELRAGSEAAALTSEAEIRRQKAVVELETARNAARRQAAEADKIEGQVRVAVEQVKVLREYFAVKNCPGNNPAAQIAARSQGRC